jgi:hypothetical protein
MKRGEMGESLRAKRTLSFVGGDAIDPQQLQQGSDDIQPAKEESINLESAAPPAAEGPATAKAPKNASGKKRAGKPANEQTQEPSTPGGASGGGISIQHVNPKVTFGRAPWPLVHFDEPELEPPPPGYETASTVVNFRLPTTMDKTFDQHIAMLDTNKSEWIRRACMHQMMLEREILEAKMAGKS